MSHRCLVPSLALLATMVPALGFGQALTKVRVFTGSGAPLELTNVNGIVLFRANDVGGYELWRSDGTTAGTVLVKDINPSGDSFPFQFVTFGSVAYFTATDSTGRHIWRSDGTAGGTVVSSTVPEVNQLVGMQGALYFSTPTGIWRHDGVATTLLRSFASGPNNLTPVGGTLFFLAGGELWKTDGTTAGTVLVKPCCQVSSSWLTAVGGTLYLVASDPATGLELWKSDGTTSGTVLVRDLNPGAAGSSPHRLRDVLGTLYFFADDGTPGLELWKTDGTEAGTVLVKDVPERDEARSTLVIGERLFFVTDDQGGAGRWQLWVSDGSDAGTVLLDDDIGSEATSLAPSLANGRGTLIFSGCDAAGCEPWKSDGTPGGTVPLGDLRPGPASSEPHTFAVSGPRVFFVAEEGGFPPTALWALSMPEPLPDVDFNRDGRTDILWRHTSSNQAAIWYMNGTALVSGTFVSPTLADAQWRVAGTADFNRDGTADLLWRHDSGQNAVWFLNGPDLVSGTLTTPPALDPPWHAAGTGDFGGDGRPDVLWAGPSGQLLVWHMADARALAAGSPVPAGADAQWAVAGSGDFNLDGRADVLWRHTVSGHLALWYMDGMTLRGSTFTEPALVSDLAWSVVGVGDYGTDGRADLLWRHGTSGEIVVWHMDGARLVSGTFTTPSSLPDPGWRVVGPR